MQLADRRRAAAGKRALLAREGLLQLCVQGLDPAGKTLCRSGRRRRRRPRSFQVASEPFLFLLPLWRFPRCRFHRPTHDPQDAVARHLLGGSRESGPGRGQTLHPEVELHQGQSSRLDIETIYLWK